MIQYIQYILIYSSHDRDTLVCSTTVRRDSGQLPISCASLCISDLYYTRVVCARFPFLALLPCARALNPGGAFAFLTLVAGATDAAPSALQLQPAADGAVLIAAHLPAVGGAAGPGGGGFAGRIEL